MTLKSKYLTLASLLLALLVSNSFAAKPTPEETCGKGWKLTSANVALEFGAFSIDSGSGTINMSNTGTLTAAGDIGFTNTLPVSTYKVTATNKDPACLAYPFTLDWITAPAPLAPVGGVGTNLGLNVYVYEPTIAATAGTTFPIVVPANSGLALPVTLTLYGDISVAYLQNADDYVSPGFRFGFTQGGTLKRSPVITATATSIVPLTLAEVIPMNFGTVAGGSVAGTIIMDPLSARSVTGDGQILATGPGTAGSFQITGGANLTYTVLITGPAILESAAGQQVTADAFTNNSLGIIPAAGTEIFNIGATLNLAPLQPAGTYSTATGAGTPYTVTVNYN